MKCTCVEDLTTKLTDHYKNSKSFKSPVESVTIPQALTFSGNCQAKTFTEVHVVLTGQKKAETVTLVHSFCPFCGVAIDD